VIGAEEFVKSIAYTIATLDPSERVRLPCFLRALRDHNRKHLGDDVIEGVHIQTTEGVDAAYDMAGFPVESGSYVRETLLELTCMGLQGLFWSGKEAKEHAQKLNEIQPGSAPSLAKERGLYVDMDSEELHIPSQLDEGEARRAVIALEWSIENFNRLPGLLEDERQWAPFAKEVRQRLSRRR
jgi:hypothetical protein